jgi:hypothetical protein
MPVTREWTIAPFVRCLEIEIVLVATCSKNYGGVCCRVLRGSRLTWVWSQVAGFVLVRVTGIFHQSLWTCFHISCKAQGSFIIKFCTSVQKCACLHVVKCPIEARSWICRHIWGKLPQHKILCNSLQWFSCYIRRWMWNFGTNDYTKGEQEVEVSGGWRKLRCEEL